MNDRIRRKMICAGGASVFLFGNVLSAFSAAFYVDIVPDLPNGHPAFTSGIGSLLALPESSCVFTMVEEDRRTADDFRMKSWYRPEEDRSEKEKAEMAQRVKAAFQKLRALSPDERDERIEAALEILRNYNRERFYFEKQLDRSEKIRSRPDLAAKTPPLPPEPDNVPWVSAMRALIEIGKPGIPKLIAELDQTDRYLTLQALGFTLRAIDDRRAIPALIRAIPRTLQPVAWGYPMQIRIDKDQELLYFMRKYDQINHGEVNYQIPEKRVFGFGLTSEIKDALFALTNQKRVATSGRGIVFQGYELGRLENQALELRGSAKQHDMQRAVVLKNMRNWSEWWTAHWRDYVANEADAQLDWIEKAVDQYARDIPELQNEEVTEIPCGRNVVVSRHPRLGLRYDAWFFLKAFNDSPLAFRDCCPSFDSEPQASKDQLLKGRLTDILKSTPCVIDLDTCRTVEPPETFLHSLPEGDRFRPCDPSVALCEWAEKQGCHLIGYRVQPAGSDRAHIAIKPLNVKLWLIDARELRDEGRYYHLDEEIRKSKKIALPSPWTGPIAHFDEKTSQFDDAVTPSFFFITKAGTCGVLRLSRWEPNIASSENLGVRYIYKDVQKK